MKELPSRQQVLSDFWKNLTKVKLDKLKSVPVMGQEVTIKAGKPYKNSHAHYDSETREIIFDKKMKGKFAVRVLMHELEHAKLKLNGFDYHVSEDEEEQLCVLAESYFEDVVYVLALLQHIGKADG